MSTSVQLIMIHMFDGWKIHSTVLNYFKYPHKHHSEMDMNYPLYNRRVCKQQKHVNLITQGINANRPYHFVYYMMGHKFLYCHKNYDD